MENPTEVPFGFCHCGCGQRTTVATRNDKAAGMVKGQPRRYITGHHRRKGPVDYIEQDCGYETPCWVWQRYVMSNGYGKKAVGNSTSVLAHRWYYEQHVGPIRPGYSLDHLCRNRRCVNPEHLEPVTTAE